MKYIRLSYPLKKNMPLYPGTAPTKIKKDKSIYRGDSCNKFILTLSNHAGTHIDTPSHFYAGAKTIIDYAPDEFVFHAPLIADCRKAQGEAISLEDLRPFMKKANTADALLIRTGFGRFREKAPVTYCKNNPYISPQAALFIRNSFPSIKLVGIDCISVSNPGEKEAGRQTHLILLNPEGFPSNPVLILEDMALPADFNHFHRLMAWPVFVSDIDSSPATVIGETDD